MAGGGRLGRGPVPKGGGDSIYQNAMRNFLKLRNSSYDIWKQGGTQDSLDRNLQVQGLDRQKPIDLQNIRNEAAGRGMVQSSGYVQNDSNYVAQEQQKRDELMRQYARRSQEQLTARNTTFDSIDSQREQAKIDWYARLAAGRLGGIN